MGKRKTPSRHVVKRKTKSGKVVTFVRGKGQKQQQKPSHKAGKEFEVTKKQLPKKKPNQLDVEDTRVKSTEVEQFDDNDPRKISSKEAEVYKEMRNTPDTDVKKLISLYETAQTLSQKRTKARVMQKDGREIFGSESEGSTILSEATIKKIQIVRNATGGTMKMSSYLQRQALKNR